MESSYLIVNKVVVKGIEQIYQCKFDSGLNVIWGDMDSGKSSILNLIDFCLGGKDEFDYDEIKSKGRVVFLEVDLNGSLTTFERVLHHDDSVVRVYNSSFDNIDTVYPKVCSPSPSIEQPDGWVSDLILEKLNIPRVKIKESKFRDDATAYRLSFRDLMKLLYLKQTKVASENLMDAANGAILNKNIEIQKFVYGVHDDQLPELNLELQSNTKKLNELKTKTDNIREFLKSTDSLTIDDKKLSALRDSINNIDDEITKLTKEKSSASLISMEFKNQLKDFEVFLKSKKKKYEENKKKLDDLIRLKSTYEHDLQCINISFKFKTHKIETDKNLSFDCPLCESKLEIDSPVISEQDVHIEVKSLKNRIQGCKGSIESLSTNQDSTLEDIRGLETTITTVRGNFDKDNISALSPLVETISTLHNSKKLVYSQLASIEKNIKLKNKLTESTDEMANKIRTISKIKTSIKEVEDKLEDIEDIVKSLSGEFLYLMRHSKLLNNYGSSVDSKFLPKFRGREYSAISSGGVRTIMSVNLYLARLSYLIKKGGNLPTFLMLDTPGQNIGRYARAKDNEDNLSDPAIYEEIYKQVIKLEELSKKHSKNYQIIVVDNDLANCLEDDNYNLVKRFDKSDQRFEKGLIFDA
jgi:DNA repair ATPase RecN